MVDGWRSTVEYPVTLEYDDNGTILVGFPDFPEAHTFGADEVDALAHAQDALTTVIDAYMKDRRDIPKPSATKTPYHVPLPALVEAKVQLFQVMRAGRVKKSDLARRLDWYPPQVDRLLEVRHASQLGQLEAAFEVLGKRLVVGVQDIAPTPKPKRVSTRRAPVARRRPMAR